jgi:hypothetical protein
MGNYILFFFLVLLLLLVAKLVIWGLPIVNIIQNWKHFGKMPTGITIPNEMPIECIDSGKKMTSTACALHSSMETNEYLLPEKLYFS